MSPDVGDALIRQLPVVCCASGYEKVEGAFYGIDNDRRIRVRQSLEHRQPDMPQYSDAVPLGNLRRGLHAGDFEGHVCCPSHDHRLCRSSDVA
ncbi:hypothetical protein [Nonomuraea fuscirosea]|uniref:hypothetical protein n=1 Tax=Nonomuraea fuscirosea TaxID=1291556 RepID=UPI0011B23E5F|nr:hypothetical protein [Nonomuraea fuscirosea]